ncbi:Serine/threonine protein kinase [Streptomyces sp. cf386]|uniref:serine/threonine-protein kinase n=1 Tax=Streptomyces sp. cf386 TaxID=1761904 RepID=UPI000886C7DA|nr:serine/threonine-protein kinase [Streptomyces sp. cf386]SDM36357.1 Serine/threonine protein kinase [Streptomyces sp. cf386]
MSSGENGQPDEAGRLLAGRYRVIAQLGRGGMGVVWRAVDEVLGREVAVKELRTYSDADGPELADLRLRMQREARAAARVRHTGVVAVHDVTEIDGRPLIVMELVDGPSLERVLRERTLDPREAAGIGAKVMDALAAAHRAGVLHRDVKPGNILLDRSGRVVLTDFGIATMDDPGDGSATHLTRTGHLVGSLDYLAPERAQGADPGPSSDVWALGATLYAAVEGSAPFRRTSTFSTLTAIISEPLPEPRNAGPLGPVLQRLMDKRSESRPEADEARELLQAVADSAGPDSPTAALLGSAGAGPVPDETKPSAPAPAPGAGPTAPEGQTPIAPTAPAGQAYGGPGQGAPGAQGLAVPGQGVLASGVPGAPPFGNVGQGAPAAQGPAGQGAPGPAGQAVPGSVGQGAPGAQGSAGQGTPGPAGQGAPGPAGLGAAWVQGPTTPGQGTPPAQSYGAVGQPGPAGHNHGHPVPGQPTPSSYGGAPVPSGQPPHGYVGPTPSPHDSAPTGPMTTSSDGPARRKGRALLAAVAVAVVLAAAGGTVALVNNTGDSKKEARATSSSATSPGESAPQTGSPDADDPSGESGLTEKDDEKDPDATKTPSRSADTGRTDGPTSAPTKTSGGGGTNGGTTGGGSGDGGTTGGGGTSGGGGTTGGGATTQAPACTSIGGGKYNCQVWRTAKSYTASGSEVGQLNAGTNYFYCQQNLGRRETYGEWTNVWWAKTDDDNGNTNVFVSDVYLEGGNNDEPVPGLPVC